MKIVFSDIKTRKERTKNISLEFVDDYFFFDGEKIKFADKVKVQGIVSLDNDIIVLEANIKTELELQCSRCLDTFIYPIDIDIEERFTNNDGNKSEDVIYVNGDDIDVTEIVENAIISSLPIKRLCKEDCKGLCQTCGANLNNETCKCENVDADVRLAGLKAFFNDKEV